MAGNLPRRLEIPVRLRQILRDAVAYGVFERGERRVVAGLPQPAHSRLGEILVIRSEPRRHVDPNRADDEEYIVRLVGQVVRVSLETVRIVAGLPENYAP